MGQGDKVREGVKVVGQVRGQGWGRVRVKVRGFMVGGLGVGVRGSRVNLTLP